MSTSQSGGAAADRIDLVDVLRAVALFGIIINHSQMSFLAGAAPTADFNVFSPLDRVVGDLAGALTFGKFFAIFSFLFGLSFSIQLANAARKGRFFSGRFAWRLAILLAIGLAHHAFFSGDILLIYALLGFLLIPFRNASNRTLVVTAFVLTLNLPGVVLGSRRAMAAAPSPQQQQLGVQAAQQSVARAQHQFAIKQTGTVAEVVRLNVTETLRDKWSFQLGTGRLWITFGLFLLGVWAGRIELLRDTVANRIFFRKLLIAAGVTAPLTTLLAVFVPASSSALGVLGRFLASLQQVSLAAFYVSAVTLLYFHQSGRVLRALAPLGRMGLSTYLMQSAFGLVVFFGLGFGLLGKAGVAASIGLAIAFFGVQILFARWWMSHFRLGPVEWLWRSLTYLRSQPMRVRG